MDNLYFGEIIRIRREELNMKQEELCEGVCERSTLSKIERGKNECSKYVAELLLDRLGLPMEFYYSKEEGTLVLKDALTLNRLLGLNQNVKTIYKDAKELFNIDLHKS